MVHYGRYGVCSAVTGPLPIALGANGDPHRTDMTCELQKECVRHSKREHRDHHSSDLRRIHVHGVGEDFLPSERTSSSGPGTWLVCSSQVRSLVMWTPRYLKGYFTDLH